MTIDSSYSDDVITLNNEDATGSIAIDANDIDSIMNSTMNSTLNYSINSSGTAGTGLNYGTYQYNTINTAPWVTVNPNTQGTLDVKGDANFEGDIKFKGRSLEELFSKIEDRLAILQPDPAKLEKYEALRKAYDHYKLLEKLVTED